MDRTVISLYQGKLVTLVGNLNEDDIELQFRLNNSLVVSDDMVSVGMIRTNYTYGMQYYPSKDNLSNTIIRMVISESIFRDALLEYISTYVNSDNNTILRMITDNISTMDNLLSLPRKYRYNTVSINLARIPHRKIDTYLNYGDITASDTKVVTDMILGSTPIEAITIDRNSMDKSMPSSWTDKFHLITVFLSLNHLKNHKHILNELHRVLAPGGILIVKEYDYRNMTPIPSLINQVKDGDMYEHFLRASHIISSGFQGRSPIWSSYRSRMEWHYLILSTGLSHVCTKYDGLSSILDQMIDYNDATSWITLNPHRIYESIYSKPHNDTIPLILEYKTFNEKSLSSIFPRLEGRLPILKKGINYDDEILTYMTPWSIAIATSRQLSLWMKEEYHRKNYKLLDGTGGAGGNILAFMGNIDITSITVYEQNKRFFNFIVNNLELYSGTKSMITGRSVSIKHVKVYNQSFPLEFLTSSIGDTKRTYITDTVIFLDVPWVTEGCGYKLHGYQYAGVYLEEFAKRILNAGSPMIVFKLPPGYRLDIKHIEHKLDKESLYAIFPRMVRKPVTRSISIPKVKRDNLVKGGIPSLELIRMRLMRSRRSCAPASRSRWRSSRRSTT